MPPAGGIGLPDAGAAHNDALGREVRPLDVLHQVVEIGVRVLQHMDAGPNHLPEVVGRNIGGHPNGNAAGTVYQQVGEPAGQYPRLPPALIEVGVPVYGVLVDVPQHLIGEL